MSWVGPWTTRFQKYPQTRRWKLKVFTIELRFIHHGICDDKILVTKTSLFGAVLLVERWIIKDGDVTSELKENY